MGAAVQRRGDRDAAFVLLGQGHLLKNRNHHRTLRRELDRVRELLVVQSNMLKIYLKIVLLQEQVCA